MTTTSKEYAVALFELATGENVLEETSDGLETVISAMRQTPEYRQLLASAAIGKAERLQALDDAFNGKVPRVLMGVLRMMVARGHIGSLDQMARDYEELRREYRGESMARVLSAVPLKESEAVAIRAELEKRFGHGISIQCEVDPSLIGGVRVEVEGRVIDGSIRNKLEQIKDVMNG
jgi:F-type H+-transporting ATPase subunit delta